VITTLGSLSTPQITPCWTTVIIIVVSKFLLVIWIQTIHTAPAFYLRIDSLEGFCLFVFVIVSILVDVMTIFVKVLIVSVVVCSI
jgi:hypothetical protein